LTAQIPPLQAVYPRRDIGMRCENPIQLLDSPAADQRDGAVGDSWQRWQQRAEARRRRRLVRMFCDLDERAVEVQKECWLFGPGRQC
jgi:hypothetical protein